MSDLMSVRLHLRGVRVLGVPVDAADRLVVGVESTREWSRCRHCGFRCRRVWDRRAKRVRDLGVSGRRTTLVWRRRRFWCNNCGERHLEDHAQFRAGLTRRFARRLVNDAQVMSIRAVARHHGVGWHRIMGLVRVHSERVAKRRRARPCPMLLVDEDVDTPPSSVCDRGGLRRYRQDPGDCPRPHESVPGQVLQRPRNRLVPASGDSRFRRFPLIPSRHRTVSTRRPPCPRPVPRSPLVHPSTHPRTQRDTTPRPPPAAPNIRTRPACEPASPSYAALITSPKPTRSTSAGCSLLIPASEPRGTPSKTSTSSCEAEDPDQANQVLGRFADLYATAQIPEYNQVVNTIIAWGEEILAYHTSRRATNGPIEGTNNLHPSPTPSRPRLHKPPQLRSPRNPHNMTTHRAPRSARTHKIAQGRKVSSLLTARIMRCCAGFSGKEPS